MKKIQNKNKKRVIIIVLAVLAILFMFSFQWYWLDSVYKNQKKIVFDKSLIILNEYVRTKDATVLGKRIESPASVIPEHYLKEIIETTKHAGTDTETQLNVDILTRKTARDLMDSLVSVSMNDKSVSVNTMKAKLKREYPHLHIKLDSTSIVGSIANLDSPLEPGHQSVEVISIYEPLKYRLTFLNIERMVLNQMQPLLVLSLFYLIICISAVLVLVSNIFKSWKLLEMKINFTNNMTHELKTPMTVLYTATEALDNFDMLKDEERSREYVQFMKSGLRQLSEMTENILNLARLDEGVVKLNIQQLNLAELLVDICYRFKPLLTDRGAKVNFSGVPTGITLYADKEHIGNIFSNLIDNALKYSENKTIITITASKNKNWLTIFFIDDGIGIKDEYHKEIFNPYFRVPKGNLYTVKGSGLGLSYVKEMIELHGGSIKLLKSEPSRGTAFEIKLPV